jgi:hypothetical protein
MTGSMSVGHDPDYYTRGGESRDTYYTGAGTKGDGLGEPQGRWFTPEGGRNTLGLAGDITAEDMHKLYADGLDPRDPRFHSEDPQEVASGDRLGKRPKNFRTREELLVDRLAKEPNPLPERLAEIEREVDDAVRQNVQFVDATYSPPKSGSAAWAAYARSASEARARGDEETAQFFDGLRDDVEQAAYEAHEQYVNHLYDRAGYARTGRHGPGMAGSWVRSEGWTVGQFLQYTSRDNDPQLHVHGPILNKQVCPDGQVRALDTALLMANKQGAGTIGDLAFAQALQRRHAARGVGVEMRMRADGVGREIVGVDQATMDLFSKRTKNMGPKLREKVAQFEETFGRSPNPLELSRLSKAASLATRRAKGQAHTEGSLDGQLKAWDAELRDEVMTGLTKTGERLASQPVGASEGEEWSPDVVITRALDAAQAKRAAFSRSELEREIGLALPDNLGADLGPGDVRKLVGDLTERALKHSSVVQVSGAEMTGDALPDDLRHADGASVYVRPGSERFATQGAVVAEQALQRAAVKRGHAAADLRAAREWINGKGQRLGQLTTDQRAAVEGWLTKGAAVKTLVGPAGTGKSFTMGAVEAGWKDLIGGKVVGLAQSEAATEVLRGEGLTAKNIAQWLGAQDRLAEKGLAASPDDKRWALGPDDLVIIDEAAMADRDSVTRIREHVERAGASLGMTGDPRQVGAVGAGGAMSLVAETDGADVYHLTEPKRFEQPWEGPASLKLRGCDPESVPEYDRRGRLLDCGTTEQAEAQAVKLYLGDYLAGKTPIIAVNSNEQAARVSAKVRDELTRLGRVGDPAIELRDGTAAGVGDFVAARRNDWDLGVTNRRTYTVREVHADGSVTVEATDGSGTRVMPAEYVAEDVTLGYAGTVHMAQGRTLDGGSYPVVDHTWGPEQLYVALTRSKTQNTACVATKREVDGQDPGASHETPRETAAGVVSGILAKGSTAEEAALAQAAAEAELHAHSQTIHHRHEAAVEEMCLARTNEWLDELAAEGTITDEDRSRFAAEGQATGQLSKLLRTVEQAGEDPRAVLRDACDKPFDGLRSLAQGVQARIKTAHPDALNPRVEHLSDAPPASLNEAWSGYVDRLAEMADDRRRELGAKVADEQPQWAVESLGPVPDDVVARAEWEHKAGVVEAYREAFPSQHESDEVALGSAPGTGSPEARASWHAAWTALGRPEASREEAELSDGALRNRVAAWDREQEWQPSNVWAEMKATGQKLADVQAEAAVRQAEADAAATDAERVRLQGLADERAAQAEVMAAQQQRLEQLNADRAAWYAETAVTRAAAQRAEAELESRGIAPGTEPDRTTAAEWLEAEAQARVEDDEHRRVTEDDVDRGQAVDLDTGGDAQVDEPEVEPTAATVSEPTVALPADVPTVAQVDEMAAVADLADAEIADRRSAEAAWLETRGQAGEDGWRDHEAAQERAAQQQAQQQAEAEQLADQMAM